LRNFSLYQDNEFVDGNYGSRGNNTNNDKFAPKVEMNYEVYVPSEGGLFMPSRPVEFAEDGKLCIFEYKAPVADETGFVKLQQVPYEIKEHALKGFMYTFFLTFFGRTIGASAFNTTAYTMFPFIPAAVFAYHYSKPLYYMLNSVIKIELLNCGSRVKLHFKFLPPMEVNINQLIKKKEENFLNETYTEPFLYPVQLNLTEKYSKFSFRSHRLVYLYGDSHEVIKQGEILRAIINNQNISV
jgi:hypothetical protein